MALILSNPTPGFGPLRNPLGLSPDLQSKAQTNILGPLAPVTDPASDPFSYFALDRTFSQYPSLDMPANQLCFGEPLALEVKPKEALKSALVSGADGLNQEQISTLAPLAKGLGFSSSQNLVHALRHLPASAKEGVLNQLPDTLKSDGSDEQLAGLKQNLHQTATKLVKDVFDASGAKQPNFEPPLTTSPDEMWNPQSLLAIYNNFKTMGDNLPAANVKDMMEPDNGNPLTFERRSTPKAQGTNDNILQALSSGMKVAETDQKDRIVLYNGAFSMNPKDIVESEDVQSFLTAFDKVKQSDTPSPQVTSLQNMLNLILPDDRKLANENGKPSGIMDNPTALTLVEFESQQLLHQALDIVRDDSKLSAGQKLNMAGLIKDIKNDIFKNGLYNEKNESNGNLERLNDVVKQLKEMATSELSAPSARRFSALEKDISEVEARFSNRDLNPELLERVVGNWFSIIDSGERKDFAEQVINHELGHFLENKNGLIDSWKNISFEGFARKDFNAKEAMGNTLQEGRDSNEFASDYAKTNPQEDFAESYRLFTRNPDQLIQQNLLKYMIIAGSVGQYTPDNYQELIDFAKKNNYTENDVQDAVKAIRGYSVRSATTDDTLAHEHGAEVRGLGVSEHAAFSPNSMNFGHGAHEHDEVPHIHTKHENMKAYDFDMGVSNYLPGLESTLNMKTDQVSNPSQSGYVLDYLTEQTDNMESWRIFSSASRKSHRFVNDFKENGVSAFPEEIQKQIPTELKESFKKDSFKAIYLVLAELRSNPELAEDFVKSGANEKLSKNFFDKKFGDLVEGLEVPQALKQYMSDPRNLVQVSGNAGQNILPAEMVERNAAASILEAQANLDDVVKTVSEGDSKIFSDPLSLVLEVKGDQFHFNEDASMVEASVDLLDTSFFKKLTVSGKSGLLDERKFKNVMELVMKGLNQAVENGNIDIETHTKDGQFNIYSAMEDPQFLKGFNGVVLKELKQEVSEVRDVFTWG